ncbi:MAG: bifunctional 5,10-methylene-tetrahydrofolate dehydrogenase/5,10-methylene-tetrahydrofolate cyclohydrolase [Omnitrophica bacterium RIFCSPLOWO2_02_FULL_45_16]|nr:MAG: bifunctional 5,10-methylene-tetrahydrofolate dehydrogenase/5,10-methylene-tetrahydrofolate cyclohydrolase [Omnitrophica bacterium RIFCSPHIGHO2_02_FULL_46_20]OGW99859.1 MAG: bifunctional 5,10-methylene-tetrahydrofolate dehydrogenase/5,10-methylene-tetrahydrofolate cyclohydrolase [Omnitrophica bacterium RIFCSPLOWO2_02_FULL_45_16]
MAAVLLDGKVIAKRLKEAIKQEVAVLKSKRGRAPKLVAVEVGQNASSAVYVKAQKKAADSVGIEYELKVVPQETSQDEAENLIDGLNNDKSVSAIILQMPVPRGMDAKKLVNLISPEKDAEGMHPQNLGKILLGRYRIGPCTAMAVMELLESTKVNLYGKEAVIVGHSEIVGKPLSLMLLNKFATTTVCHIGTGERGALPGHVKRAEILIVAVGKAGIIKGDWIKDGAIVIDVGINKVGDKIVGDVEFAGASQKALCITQVPGGVGSITTTMLMRNTVELFKTQR